MWVVHSCSPQAEDDPFLFEWVVVWSDALLDRLEMCLYLESHSSNDYIVVHPLLVEWTLSILAVEWMLWVNWSSLWSSRTSQSTEYHWSIQLRDALPWIVSHVEWYPSDHSLTSHSPKHTQSLLSLEGSWFPSIVLQWHSRVSQPKTLTLDSLVRFVVSIGHTEKGAAGVYEWWSTLNVSLLNYVNTLCATCWDQNDSSIKESWIVGKERKH